MKRNIFLFFIAHAMLILISCSSRISGSRSGRSIKISSVPLEIPVIKGLSANPLLCLTIAVPAGSEVNYSRIYCQLDNNAINSIQKLDIYYTDTVKKFSDKNLVGSLTQLSAETVIPINMKLKPGLNYIWLSAVLLPTADIDKKITLNITSLADENDSKQSVQQSDLSYTRRLGIAVRKAGDNGVHTYRIPGITMTSKGTLIAVYDIRYKNSRDLPNNIDIGMSRSTDNGKTWEPMKKIIDMGEPNENNGIGDPAILFDPVTNKIWVTALWSKGNRSIAGSQPGLSPDSTGQFIMAFSDDDGVTWSAPNTITPQVKNPAWHLYFNGPGNGIVMQNGTLVFPSQYWDENKSPHSAIIYSKDHGNTWSSGVGAKSNTTESQVVETSPGTLMLSMRDNRGKFRSIASTTDMGSHWVEHPTSTNTLPDPICMASIIKADIRTSGSQKQVLFFSNPASSDRSLRDSMTVRASFDMGSTWPNKDRLLIDERNFFGYSVLVRIDENMLGLLYEGIGDLYFVRIPVSDIIK